MCFRTIYIIGTIVVVFEYFLVITLIGMNNFKILIEKKNFARDIVNHIFSAFLQDFIFFYFLKMFNLIVFSETNK